MSRRIQPRALARSVLVGMLWGVAVALLEAALFNRWFHVELQQAIALVELSLNYAVYSGVAALLLHIALATASRARRHRRDGRSTRRSAPDTADLVEALIAAALIATAIASFLQFGPLHRPMQSPATIALLAGAAIATALLAGGWYRLASRRRRIVRLGLVVWVVAALLWTPLFAPYTGALRAAGRKAARGSHRNVLFIVTDTLRADFLNCYGANWNASPAADRLAAGGALFEHHIAQSTWTLPSTASLLTSRYPSSHGAVAPAHPIDADATTLAQALQAAGYRTAAFTENFHILPRNGFGRGCDSFWAIWLPWVFDDALLYRVAAKVRLPLIEITEKERFPHPVTRPEQVNWDARTTTARALKWLRTSGDAPFLAYIHYMGPHGPYGPREYLLDRKRPEVAVTDHPRDMGGALPLGERGAPASPQALEDMRTLYAADILYVEREIERILAWLRETDKLAETLVVFTSDHGEEFYDHNAWNHGSSAFQEVLRVPLVMSAPGLIDAGVRVDAYTRHIDIMPTVLDLVGVDIPEHAQGRSLKPLLAGEVVPAVPAYSEVFPVRPPGCSIVSLIQDKHKLIRIDLGGDSASLLYDLQADPLELDDLYARQIQLGDSLTVEMSAWDTVAHAYSAASEAVPLDSRQLDALRALGYIK